MPPPPPPKFTLNPRILGHQSAVTIEGNASMDGDVLRALISDKPFPDREIKLGRVQLSGDSGKPIEFQAGPGTVSFTAAAGLRTGIGVYQTSAAAIADLQVAETPGLDLSIGGADGSRYLMMLFGWNAQGNFTGSHPIGALGSLTFGAEAKTASVYAVMRRFQATAGARTVTGETVASWKLPRHLKRGTDLPPATWMVAQVDGSIAIQIAAGLGYDFNYVRDLKLLNAPAQLGVRIDAAVKATLGFEASGRYLVVVGRESDDATSEVVRLRLFKQSGRGFQFGLNLTAGVRGLTNLPEGADDFMKSVFGVHSLQIVHQLQVIERWTDPKKDMSETVARLTTKTGFALLTRVTGIDAETQFEKARQQFLGVLRPWTSLPERVSAELWQIVPPMDDKALAAFKAFLEGLAQPDKFDRANALAKALQTVAFADLPAGRFLTAIAERGLIALGDRLDEVQQIASTVLSILNGDFVRKLQGFIEEKLGIDQILKAAKETDFRKLDDWLVLKLGDFLGKKIDFTELNELKNAINAVVTIRHKVYEQARKALTNRYSIDFAATYQKATAQTALLDVNFDLSKPAAQALFQRVVVESKMEELLMTEAAGVSLNQAVLSHEITRKAVVQLHMPYFDFRAEHVNRSLAKVTAEEDSGRVLVYEVDASDTVTALNRFRSQLSVLGAIRMQNFRLAMDPTDPKTVAYQYRQVKSDARLAELEARATPFVERYLSNLFPGGRESLHTFLFELDQTIENITQNGKNEFGDILVAADVSLPGRVMEAWFRRRTPEELRTGQMDLSRRLQIHLKRLIPLYYMQDLDHLEQNAATAALLVWAAIPPCTSVDFRDGVIRRLNTDESVFWDWPDPALRRAMATSSRTAANLGPALATARQRLVQAGETRRAGFFEASETNDFFRLAAPSEQLRSLLLVEAQMVEGAAESLKLITDALSDASTAPTKAIALLSEFGAKLTDTFHHKLRSVYGTESLRTLGSLLLLESSAALDPNFAGAIPNAMVNLTVLKEPRTFKLEEFLDGKLPAREEVAVAQTLVRQAFA